MNAKDVVLKAVKVLYEQFRSDDGLKSMIGLKGVCHHLKIWPEEFQRVLERKKTFEYRKNDRDFQQGEFLMLEEYEPIYSARHPKTVIDGRYTGRKVICFVPGILAEGFGLPEGYVCLSIIVISEALWKKSFY